MSAARGRDPRLAIVGAAGVVGSQIADLIGTRGFPCSELKLFGSEHGASDAVESGENRLPVEPLVSPADLGGFDIGFLAVSQSTAAEIIRARPGPVLIDMSAAMRAPGAAPMAAPGVTARERLRHLASEKVFAAPHPGAHAIATVLSALGIDSGFAGATVMMGASADGHESVSKLFSQSAELLNARLELEEDETQAAFNVFTPEGGRELAAAIVAQVAALMGGGPSLAVEVIRVPVFHGGATTIYIAGDRERWPARLRAAPGVLLLESDEPAELIDAIGNEAIVAKIGDGAGGAVVSCFYDSARLAAMAALWLAENLTLLSSS